MTQLDTALQQAVEEIPDCMACGYVDLETGLLLDIHTLSSHPRPVMDLLAAATAELFAGPNISLIESLWQRQRKLQGLPRSYFQEIVVNSDHLLHIFLRAEAQAQIACFIFPAGTDLDSAMAHSRDRMPALAAAL